MTFRGTIHDINRGREDAGLAPLPDNPWGQSALPPVPSIYVTPTDYPDRVKIGLLQLHANEHRNSLAAECLQHLDEMGVIDDPTPDDWETLRQHGRVVGLEGRRRLTPMGLHAAQMISRDLAIKFGIHSITRRRGTGNHGPSVTCTCGFRSYSSIMNGNSLERYAGDHLQQAREGTLPAAYRFGALPS